MHQSAVNTSHIQPHFIWDTVECRCTLFASGIPPFPFPAITRLAQVIIIFYLVFLSQPPLMTLVSSLGFLHFVLNIETGVIFQDFLSNGFTPLPSIPSDWLAQLHEAAPSSLAWSPVTFPCSLLTDSILKMYLHPIWCKLLFVFHLYHYFYMLSLRVFI